MNWLQAWDVAAFRFINRACACSLLDGLMPFCSANQFFFPALVLLGGLLVWKGGARGRVCVVMLVVLVGIVDNLVVGQLKELFSRPRPFLVVPDVRELVGRGGSYSMPSAHAANWCAGLMVAWFYFARSAWVMAPLALLVSFSRVYLGVHYPSDILGGWLVGATIGGVGVLMLDGLWQWLGSRWFPLWWRSMPSLKHPQFSGDPLSPRPGLEPIRNPPKVMDQQWRRLGYLIIGLVLLARLAYLAAPIIELSEDEAYQWLWSKHLDLSYYSKPPMIAYAQFLGTHVWGDNAFGVRFLAPIISALVALMVLNFLSHEVNARTGLWTVLAATAAPMMAAGSILMTIDPLSVLFWTAGMIAGWKAVQIGGRTRDWVWVGLWAGLGFLSKYTALFQWLSFAMVFAFWPTSRRHLRRPGPWVALLVNLICALPVIFWNARHGWVTVHHLQDRAGLNELWHPTMRFFVDFTLAETALLNPCFFVGVLWSIGVAWRFRERQHLHFYLLCMGLPVLLIYWLYTFRARVQPNWIAPAITPLFCLMMICAEARLRAGAAWVRPWLIFSLGLGLPVVVLLHDTNLINKIARRPLPARMDPLARVRGWAASSQVVAKEREALLAEGKRVFIIGDHYGTTGLLSFYLPEAKAGVPDKPLVYYQRSETPENQFYFWRDYRDRRGENAIYVQQTKEAQAPPARLQAEFSSITDLGMRDVVYRGKVLHRLQLFACRDLR